MLSIQFHTEVHHPPQGSAILRNFFFFECYGDHRDLHSFPTRRSSDLSAVQITRFPPACEPEMYGVPNSVRRRDRKSTRLNSSHVEISYAVFCLKKKNGAPRGVVLHPTRGRRPRPRLRIRVLPADHPSR